MSEELFKIEIYDNEIAFMEDGTMELFCDSYGLIPVDKGKVKKLYEAMKKYYEGKEKIS